MDRDNLLREAASTPNAAACDAYAPVVDSGIWALSGVAIQYGVSIDGIQLTHQLSLSGSKARSHDLLRIAKESGLHARLQTGCGKADLAALPRPAVLRLKSDQYVILGLRTSFANDVFGFGVPHPVRRTDEDLCNEWSGEAILIGRSANAPAGASEDAPEFGLRWFLPSLWRYRKALLHILLASISLQVCALIAPMLFQVVIDKVVIHNTYATLIMIGVALVIGATFETILQQLRAYVVLHTGSRLDFELGRRLFEHLSKLPLSFFETTASGQIVARIREVDGVRAFLTGQVLTAMLDVVFGMLFFGLLVSYSLQLTAVVLISVAIYALIAQLTRPIRRERAIKVFGRGAENQQFLFESIGGMATLKAAAIEASLRAQWDNRLGAFIQANFRSSMLGAISGNSSGYVNKITSAAVLLLGASQVMSGHMTIGMLVAFNMLVGLVAAPFVRLSSLYQDIQQVKVSMSRLGDIMNASVEVSGNVLTNLPPMRGAVRFRGVTFRYSADTPDVLRNCDLEIPAGQVIGIVGPSGSGKSTLSKLIQRLYLPQHGQVQVDGVDIARIHPTWLRQQIGVVLQENVLFSKTIHENIALAAPYLSRDHVIELARQAGADEFISKLPQGYETPIVERGANLSGGQRQRLAIARALARNPRILVLDEATSAVDYETERIIQSNLKQISRGRTVIIIAHRLAAVRHCDRIVSLVDGCIVEDGTHEELLRYEDGTYRRLWTLQVNP